MTEVKVGVIVEGGPGAPVASVSLTEMTVIEGHTVSMQCQASGKIDPNYTEKGFRHKLTMIYWTSFRYQHITCVVHGVGQEV